MKRACVKLLDKDLRAFANRVQIDSLDLDAYISSVPLGKVLVLWGRLKGEIVNYVDNELLFEDDRSNLCDNEKDFVFLELLYPWLKKTLKKNRFDHCSTPGRLIAEISQEGESDFKNIYIPHECLVSAELYKSLKFPKHIPVRELIYGS